MGETLRQSWAFLFQHITNHLQHKTVCTCLIYECCKGAWRVLYTEEWKLFEGRDQSLGILIQGPRNARMGGLLLVGWSTEKPGSMWLTTFCLKPRNKNTHPFCSMFVAAPFPCHWHLQLNCLLEALQAERPRGWLQETKFLVGTTCCKVPPPFGWAKEKETAEFHMQSMQIWKILAVYGVESLWPEFLYKMNWKTSGGLEI